ncbi:RTX toxin transporter [alpha proteobacterium U9-1i]|nr:RTX toxin transporter [alpha proteobacterium U9-1i]
MIVPEGTTFVVEAQVLNRDAGFVREGQDVRVKLEAFPFTRYGVLDGRLVFLSRDACLVTHTHSMQPSIARLDCACVCVTKQRTCVSRAS